MRWPPEPGARGSAPDRRPADDIAADVDRVRLGLHAGSGLFHRVALHVRPRGRQRRHGGGVVPIGVSTRPIGIDATA